MLLLISIVLLICAVLLAVYIMISERTANFHKIWDLALAGHKLARLYLVLIVFAFSIAVVAWFFAFAEHKASKKLGSSEYQQSLQFNSIPC